MDVTRALVCLLAGFAAGAVNSMAGGGTLISFPILVATGLPARTATITSAVGLLPGYAGGSVAYRAQLSNQRARIVRLGGFAVIGAVIGAVVLLVTSDAAFRVVVPYLVLLSCLLLAVQTRVARAVARHQETKATSLTAIGEYGGVLVSAIYGTYFGAGLGVLLLAILGIFIAEDLQRLNALKGVLSLLVSVVGVVVFALFGTVHWFSALWLAIGSWTGGAAGVRLALRMKPAVLRWTVTVLGVLVAVVMIVKR